MKLPYKVLFDYVPPYLECPVIGTQLLYRLRLYYGFLPLNDPEHPAQDWTPWNSVKDHAEVKNWTPDAPDGKAWHQDGDITPGARINCAIVLWANKTPTEFKWTSNGKIYQPKPYEVVVFHNAHCYHRQPPKCPNLRYIFRQRIEIPKYMELP